MKRLLPLLLVLSSCASRPATVPRIIPVYVAKERPQAYTGVRTGEHITRYTTGPMLSADRRTLHAPHTVYRILRTNGWNLAPRIVSGKSTISSDEIEAEKRHQEAISRRLETMEQDLQRLQSELQARLKPHRSHAPGP